MNDERPSCKCHGQPMYSRKLRTGSQGWECAVRKRERHQRWYARNRNYYEVNREKRLEQGRKWRANNRDKVREWNSRRIRVAGMYLGTFGFTDREREKLLEVANGKAD